MRACVHEKAEMHDAVNGRPFFSVVVLSATVRVCVFFVPTDIVDRDDARGRQLVQ